MFLKSLVIKKEKHVIREILFHKGLNLIIDETHRDHLQESGNNVGKTTVLRLIDFCLGSSGKNIYQDPEFREKSNTEIESFLKNNNIIIFLTLKENLEDDESREIIIKRNFLKYPDKIQEINNILVSNNEFDLKLKELIFDTNVDKPTFRQIIAKNIRYEKNRLQHTIKVLHDTTTLEEYEALYFFWFGIITDDTNKKQKLSELKKTEEKVLQRLKRENSESEIEQALSVINRDIKELEVLKDNFNLNENYEDDIRKLNEIKLKLNKLLTEIGKLIIRKELIKESKDDLEKEFAEINTSNLEEIYKTANSFIPDLHIKFEELLKFHNNMLSSKIKYITEELPSLEEKIKNLNNEIINYRIMEKDLSNQLHKMGAIEGLEEIIQKLNSKYESKGRYEEQLHQLKNSQNELDRIKNELDEVNKGIYNKAQELQNRITLFNKYFSKLSERLYDEQFILSADKNERAYELKISSIEGNLGTGKKKGEIAAFDLAYIQFCEEVNIPCLHFILYDQIENIHDNQINTLAEVSNETNSQVVVPVLKDKLPEEIQIDSLKILSLSQNDKLFKI